MPNELYIKLQQEELFYHLDMPNEEKKYDPFKNIKDILTEGLVPGKNKGKTNWDDSIISEEVCVVKNKNEKGRWAAVGLFLLFLETGGILYLLDKELKKEKGFIGVKEVIARREYKDDTYNRECKLFGTVKPDFIKKIIVFEEDLEKIKPVVRIIKKREIELYAVNRKNETARKVEL